MDRSGGRWGQDGMMSCLQKLASIGLASMGL